MSTAPQAELFPEVRWTPMERAVFRPREQLKPSEWAEKNIVVTSGSRPGPWSNNVTPYLTEIMDTSALPFVREEVVVAAPQTGKTSAIYNIQAYRMAGEPGPGMVVMPDEKAAKRIYDRRIEPMWRQSPNLAALRHPDPRKFSASGIELVNGSTLDMAWAGSASVLASTSQRDVLFDESAKYRAALGPEASPIDLGRVRTRSFPFSHLILEASTPTTEACFVWQALLNCQETRAYYVPCPHCGAMELMRFRFGDDEQILGGVMWPKDERDPIRILARRLAWYECSHCRGKWNEVLRDQAVRAGIWQPVKWNEETRWWAPAEPVERPISVGFHVPAWLSIFVSFSECAAEFLKAQKNKTKLRHFANGIEGLPWIDWAIERLPEAVLKLKDERPAGLVPAGIAALTAFVDVQMEGFWYEVRAWGYGPEGESWQIAEGHLSTWEAVEGVIYTDRYRDAEGNDYPIRMALIDSGDGHRTAEIYDWCRQHPGCYPSKGRRNQKRPWYVTRLDSFPDGRPIPGGLKLYNIDTTYYKDRLASKLATKPGDPGAWHLNADTSHDYAQHMCAEFKDEHGVWQNPPGKRNDLWDCGVGNLCLHEILRIAYRPNPSEEQPRPEGRKKPKPKPKGGALW